MNAGETPLPAIQAMLARKSLAHFVRKSWHVLEPETPLIWNWHMQAVCDHVQALLEGKIPENNLVINVPPGSAKSRIVSVCAPAWWWIDHPAWRAIFASGNPRVTTRDSLYCRTLISSPWYAESFDPKWRLSPDENTKLKFSNTATGFRMAVSAGSKVTGDRADALFWDDPIDATEAYSKATRESVITWYDQAFSNRLNSPVRGTRCGIAQRLHEGDLSGHVLKSGLYAHLRIRQEYFPPKDEKPEKPTVIGWIDPRSKPDYPDVRGPEGGLLMDPERFPLKVLAGEKVTLGSAGYAGQHQQDPSPAEGEMFKRRYWKTYKSIKYTAEGVALPMTPAELRALYGIESVILAADTALSTKRSADYTAVVVIGISRTNYYVLDRWIGRVESPDAKKQIIAMAAKWNPIAVVVEGEGSHSGKAICQELQRDTRLAVKEVPNIDKIVGANMILPTVEAGVVSIPEDAPWTADFIDSTAGFPRLVHDDDVDAFRIALHYAVTGNAATGLLDYLRESRAAADAAKKTA